MYAIVQTGGKQLKVSKGDMINVEKLDIEAGKKTTLGTVLMVSDGKKADLDPKMASVECKVVEQTRGEKVAIFKKKRRQNYRRTKGHRQMLTKVEITDIKTAKA